MTVRLDNASLYKNINNVNYTCLCLNKQKSKCARILNLSDAVHSIRYIWNTAIYLRWSILQIFYNISGCRHGTISFSVQGKFCGTSALYL